MKTLHYTCFTLANRRGIGLLLGLICLTLFNGAVAVAGAADEIKSLKLGKVEVLSFQDVPATMDRSLFSGADPAAIDALWPKTKSGALEKAAPASINVFMIKTPGQNILVDAGFGSFSDKRAGKLQELLKKAGIAPESIKAVLVTHMHGDHIGGLLDKEGKPAFANALIYVSGPEKAFWSDDTAMNAAKEASKRNFEVARKSLAAYGDKVNVFEFGKEIIPGITALDAVGHTPGHTAFLLRSGALKMLFWGDLAHAAAVQIPNPDICASYDMDMPQAVKSRRALMKLAAAERMIVAGAHLPFPGTGRIEAMGNGFIYKPGH